MARPKIIETPKQIHDRQKLAVLTRILRVALGLSQLELAKRTGLSFSTIAKFENGELRLHENKKAKIFSLFDEAGLHYSINKGKINVTLPKDMLEDLMDNGLIWPITVDQFNSS